MLRGARVPHDVKPKPRTHTHIQTNCTGVKTLKAAVLTGFEKDNWALSEERRSSPSQESFSALTSSRPGCGPLPAAMYRHRGAPGALALLFLLTGACLPSLCAPGPVPPPPPAVGSLQTAEVPRRAPALVPGPRRGVADEVEGGREEEEEEEEEELFKDVDPKTLAAVLLEALNKPQTARGAWEEEEEEEEEVRPRPGGEEEEEEEVRPRPGGEEEEEEEEEVRPRPGGEEEEEEEEEVRPRPGGEEEEEEEEEEVRPRPGGEEEEEGDEGADATTDDPKEPALRAAESREREQPELELVMAAAALQGREGRARQEERERQEKREEEERLTEKVTSRTVSQVVPVKPAPPPAPQPGAAGEEPTGVKGQGSAPPAAAPGDLDGEPRNEEEEEEEEQLNAEELKNLEAMMKEFPSLGAASKRDDGERGGRGSNDVLPRHQAQGPPRGREKLRWQEETQKGLGFPSFRGGNFMDEFEEAGAGAPAETAAPSPDTDAMMEDEGEEEEGEDLSPEEEEAQAKAEQEEVRRQAAEAQRAKAEEEKLADIASDMLLQYMVKQNGGKRKYRGPGRKYPSLLNTAEDKRSDEVQEADEEDDDDDIDPQTIDKLIEISSKLHLPADDVVDIINDVEEKKKKKKKEELPSQVSPWLRPSSSSLASSSVRGMSASPINQIKYLSPKQSAQAVNPLKTWFSEDPGSKLSSTNQDPWRKPTKPQPSNLDIFPQLQTSLSSNKGFIAKPQRTFWGRYPPYTAYPGPYQKTPYRGYYPVYLPSPPKPKPRYYLPNAYPYAFGNPRGTPPRYDYDFPPKRHYHSWVQPRLRKPPASVQRSYYQNYLLPTYLQTFQRNASPRSPSRTAGRPAPRPRGRFYYPPAPVVGREARLGNQADDGNYDDVDVQQLLAQRLRKFQ
ncbi:unnamed protein product [Arctogadus glacialis]